MLAPLGPRGRNLEGKTGGIARAATVIRGIQAKNPRSILLHAGDFSMGDIYYNAFLGVPELKILKNLGCAAMAVGNHEWDLTPSTLLTVLETAFADGGFPLLSANTLMDDSSLALSRHFIAPSTVIRAGELKVGIFGLTTPLANTISSPAPAIIDTPYLHAARAVASLMEKGCRPIICLSHLGYALDRMLAALVPGIDIIVGGHDHRLLKRPVAIAHGEDTTWILQTSGFYREVGVVRMVVGGGKVRLRDVRVIPVNSAVQADQGVDAMVTSLTRQIEKNYGRLFTSRVGYATTTLKEEATSLPSPGYHDTPVGDLVADAFRDLTGTDIAIEPGGSTAQPIYAGPIVPVDLFRVVGYGFNPVNTLGYHLVRFDMQGEALMAGIKYSLSTIGGDDEFFLQVSGLHYTYDASVGAPNCLVSATIHGSPVDSSRTYSVTANAFVAAFMGQLGIPLTNLHEFGGDTTEFMALTRYVAKLGTLRPRPASRILSVGKSRGGRVVSSRTEGPAVRGRTTRGKDPNRFSSDRAR
jgi:2',3'-cyclic-nucleotide 2'-phosphodiesterase (5'-nucleotidase family)